MGRGSGGAENLEQTVQRPLRGELSGRESDCRLTRLHRLKSAGLDLGLGFDSPLQAVGTEDEGC